MRYYLPSTFINTTIMFTFAGHNILADEHCTILEGARASTGLSLLCVNVGYKHWSNNSNSNMQPITIKFAERVGLYFYIILSALCTVDIIDQVELWTPLYTGYPL